MLKEGRRKIVARRARFRSMSTSFVRHIVDSVIDIRSIGSRSWVIIINYGEEDKRGERRIFCGGRFINRATNGRVLRDSSRSLESKIERHLFYAMHAGVITKRTARSSWIKDGGACSQREARAELLRKHAVWSLSGVIYAMIRRMKLCTTPEDFEPFFRHRIILLVSSLLSTPTNPISQRCLITRVHSRFLRRDSATWSLLAGPRRAESRSQRTLENFVGMKRNSRAPRT